MKTLIILLLTTTLGIHAHAQKELRFENRLSTSVYRIEPVVESFNNVSVAKVFNGLFYERALNNRWNVIIGVDAGEKIVDDRCKNCMDGFGGEGKYKEFNMLLGGKFNLSNQKSHAIVPFLQSDFYYAKSRYSGNFTGGIDGQSRALNNRYNGFGWIGRIGLDMVLLKYFVVTPSTGLKLGSRRVSGNGDHVTGRLKDNGWLPLELRVGVNF